VSLATRPITTRSLMRRTAARCTGVVNRTYLSKLEKGAELSVAGDHRQAWHPCVGSSCAVHRVCQRVGLSIQGPLTGSLPLPVQLALRKTRL
jgi:hypothetical protein